MTRKMTLQPTHREAFVRVLGHRPRIRPSKYSTVEEFAVFTETFGPPETVMRNGKPVLVWTFMRHDGTNGFALLSRELKARTASFPIKVELIADRGSRSFRVWTAVRLHRHIECKERPLFVNDTERNFSIKKYN